MTLFLWILGACFVSGALSAALAGLFLGLPEDHRRRALPRLVAFATGTLLGASTLGLLPTSIEHSSPERALTTFLAGILFFFVLEQALLWRHCHEESCEFHDASGKLLLIGDAVHNLIDGAVIAGAFLSSVPLGITATLAVFAHEIPQELGDFAVLLKNGYTRRRAFLLNILVSLTAVPGAVLVYLSRPWADRLLPTLMALSAAGFVYVALADLIPGFRPQRTRRDTLGTLLFLLAGLGAIALIHTRHTH